MLKAKKTGNITERGLEELSLLESPAHSGTLNSKMLKKTAGIEKKAYGEVRDLKSDAASHIKWQKRIAKEEPRLMGKAEAATSGAIAGSIPGGLAGLLFSSKGRRLKTIGKAMAAGSIIGGTAGVLGRKTIYRN